MKNHTEEVSKERLSETVDKLTEENQRCFIGVLEALTFAQLTSSDMTEKKTIIWRHNEIIEE